MQKIKKKGVSPIIATMLLVVIVIVLAAIIFLWMKGFTREVVTKDLGFGEENIEMICEDIVINGDYLYDDLNNKEKLTISNDGNAPIASIKIKEIATDGTYTTSKLQKNGEDIGIKQGKSATVDVIYQGIVARVVIIPVLMGNSNEGGLKEYVCDERYGAQVTID